MTSGAYPEDLLALPEVRDAAQRDAAAARELLADLRAQGRAGHPAIPTLEFIAAGASDPEDLIQIASIAFETGVRVALGADVAACGPDDPIPDHVESLLVSRDPMPWEPDEALSIPYREVDWRGAVATAGRMLAEERFAMPEGVPGGALLDGIPRATGNRADFVARILGDAPRNDVLDPVVAAGCFLAQALPHFVDIDMLLREAREARIAARGAA
jgi:hypothetical protein